MNITPQIDYVPTIFILNKFFGGEFITSPVYALEPFYGGSHKQFLQGLQQHLCLDLRILPMSPHHWKWRMQGSALYYADRIRQESQTPGTILASDFVNLAALRGMIPDPDDWRWLLYFHENQLTYPFREKRERDLTYAHLNILSALAADVVYFNSDFHRENFLNAVPRFYSHFTDYKPQNVTSRLREKSLVVPLGLDLKAFDALPAQNKSGPGIILWNQRWEHDKNPETFFNVLFQLAEDSVPFQLIVCGQHFNEYPKIFDEARQRLRDHLFHWGFVESKEEYGKLLQQSDIVVSTAQHEFFGIAVLEAMYCRCYPLLPKRLVYPAYIPDSRKKENLYTSTRDLYRKLKFALERIEATRQINFSAVAAQFDWSVVAPQWKEVLSFRQ